MDTSRPSLPPDIPAEAAPFLLAAGYLEPDRLSAGDPAPDVSLCTLDGAPVRLAEFWKSAPVVLIFGSYT